MKDTVANVVIPVLSFVLVGAFLIHENAFANIDWQHMADVTSSLDFIPTLPTWHDVAQFFN